MDNKTNFSVRRSVKQNGLKKISRRDRIETQLYADRHAARHVLSETNFNYCVECGAKISSKNLISDLLICLSCQAK